jgi:hypothetical protein
MAWIVSYSPLTLTASNPTAQSSPDGLATYATSRDGSNLGKSWVAAATSASVDLAASTSGTPGYVLIAGSNLTSAATANFYKGAQSGSRTLLCALSKVPGTNLWVGIPNQSVTSSTSFSLDVADATLTQIEIPYIEAGTGTVLTYLGRPSRSYDPVDPSTRSVGQTGAVFTNRQPKQMVVSFAVQAQDSAASASLDVLRAAFEACGTAVPLFVCLDTTNPARYGNSIYGLLQQIPKQPIGGGMVTEFTVTIAECVA